VYGWKFNKKFFLKKRPTQDRKHISKVGRASHLDILDGIDEPEKQSSNPEKKRKTKL
jgi:hypothetical protein